MNGCAERPCDLKLCPLNRLKAGGYARIRRLPSGHDQRLREIGFCEEQVVRLLCSAATVICQVCNARLAISGQLAEHILVEPLAGARA